MNTQKNNRKPRYSNQRASTPDALVLTCTDNPEFGKKFIETFRSLKPKEKPDE